MGEPHPFIWVIACWLHWFYFQLVSYQHKKWVLNPLPHPFIWVVACWLHFILMLLLNVWLFFILIMIDIDARSFPLIQMYFNAYQWRAAVGGFLLGRTLAVLITMTLGTSMAARQGPVAMAAHQICIQVWLAVSLLTDALAASGQVFNNLF